MSESLSQEQKNTIAQWVADGASIADVQKNIRDTFGLSMTYMDVRFLVDDLNLTLQDKAEPVAEETAVETAPAEAPFQAEENSSAPSPNEEAAPPPASGQVRVTVDPVQRPGVALGGRVTFSDGLTGQWQLDSYGQLGFVPPHQGYQPTPADIQAFQSALQQEVAKMGY